MMVSQPRTALIRLGAALSVAGVALTGCGGTSSTPVATPAGTATGAVGSPTTGATDSSVVLPVTSNPINNAATAKTLKIESVLVENNVNPADGSTVDDHLEIALQNTGQKTLAGFEVFYTFSDPTAGTAESYYAKLPKSFTIPAGESRIVHFDNTGATDHFAANPYSLYSTSKNAVDVTVVVSATNAAVQTATVQKDAGGAEQAD